MAWRVQAGRDWEPWNPSVNFGQSVAVGEAVGRPDNKCYFTHGRGSNRPAVATRKGPQDEENGRGSLRPAGPGCKVPPVV